MTLLDATNFTFSIAKSKYWWKFSLEYTANGPAAGGYGGASLVTSHSCKNMWEKATSVFLA